MRRSIDGLAAMVKQVANCSRACVITAAMLDRIMHKCEVFDMDGESYRIAHREWLLKG